MLTWLVVLGWMIKWSDFWFDENDDESVWPGSKGAGDRVRPKSIESLPAPQINPTPVRHLSKDYSPENIWLSRKNWVLAAWFCFYLEFGFDFNWSPVSPLFHHSTWRWHQVFWKEGVSTGCFLLVPPQKRWKCSTPRNYVHWWIFVIWANIINIGEDSNLVDMEQGLGWQIGMLGFHSPFLHRTLDLDIIDLDQPGQRLVLIFKWLNS